MGDDESDGIQEPELPDDADDAGNDEEIDDDVADSYRNTLIKSMQASQDSYDKYIISLSSSALGLSFVFLDKLIDIDHAYFKWLLLSSWISWALAITFTVTSFYVSQRALEHALNEWEDSRSVSRTTWDNVTRWLNAFSGLTFIGGVGALISFVYLNLK